EASHGAIFSGGPLTGLGVGGRPDSTLRLPEALRAAAPAFLSYAAIACMTFSTPTMLSTRVRLYVSTQSAISVATFGNVLHRKCVAPILIFMVPKGCSTVSRRVRMALGFSSSRFWTVSKTASCSQRLIARCFAVVHWDFSGHFPQTVVQYIR